MSLLLERPAAAREGGAIHVHGARGARPNRPVSRALRRPPRARPEPVGRPLGEHGGERQRELSKDGRKERERLPPTLRYRALLPDESDGAAPSLSYVVPFLGSSREDGNGGRCVIFVCRAFFRDSKFDAARRACVNFAVSCLLSIWRASFSLLMKLSRFKAFPYRRVPVQALPPGRF